MRYSANFPALQQLEQVDCGPTCLQIISKFYGVNFSIEYLRSICDTNKVGSNLLSLFEAAKVLHYIPSGVKINFENIENDMLPCIAHWNQNHFVVIYKIEENKIFISDPAIGLLTYTVSEFLNNWSTNNNLGILLLLETTDAFYTQNEYTKKNIKLESKKLLKNIFVKHKKQFTLSTIALLVGALLQFAFPIITQQLVDKSVLEKNMQIFWILLFAQIAFYTGKLVTEIFNTFILLKIGNVINLDLISSFFDKLFKLPIQYFSVKRSGDIMQRINDHNRVQHFITNSLITIAITLTTVLIFSIILFCYNPLVFLIFLSFTIVYIFWFQRFSKQRVIYDYKNFSKLGERQDKNIEIIKGMTELKLHNAGTKKKNEWRSLQNDIFKINYDSLLLHQYQFTGATIINELKNILLTFLTAYFVMNGTLSLGEMLAVAFIVGQLNMPIHQLLIFLQQYQDATLSFLRIQEVHQFVNEDDYDLSNNTSIIPNVISITNLSFCYGKFNVNKPTLLNVSFEIQPQTITAIVGASGCGKSTLFKLLLKFYKPNIGTIKIGNIPLNEISNQQWRNSVSVVLQEAYIFNDTISNNICIADEVIDLVKLNKVIKNVELENTILKFPLGLNTKIGENGIQLSGGEKQRIVLARALYSEKPYLFLDEATSSLDAISESNIMNNIRTVYKHITIVIIAHRFTTIQNASHIVVLENGCIVEKGTHTQLMNCSNSVYRSLKKEQFVN